MSLYNQIMKARDELLNEHRHIRALHLGSRAQDIFTASAQKLSGRGNVAINRWMGMELEVGPSGTGPDYAAISYKKDESSNTNYYKRISK